MTRDEMGLRLVQNQAWMMKMAMPLTRDVVDARDLIQDTCLQCLEKYDSFGGGEWQAFAYTVMRNLWLDKCRRVAFRSDCYNDIGYRLSDSYEFDERAINVGKALDGVAEKYRTALMKYAVGYSYNEIAEQMGVPLTSVQSYIHIARTKIREYYV